MVTTIDLAIQNSCYRCYLPGAPLLALGSTIHRCALGTGCQEGIVFDQDEEPAACGDDDPVEPGRCETCGRMILLTRSCSPTHTAKKREMKIQRAGFLKRAAELLREHCRETARDPACAVGDNGGPCTVCRTLDLLEEIGQFP